MLRISLKFVPRDRINNIPSLVQIMAWHWPGDKPLSEPMVVSLLTHICVTRPQWVKETVYVFLKCLLICHEFHISLCNLLENIPWNSPLPWSAIFVCIPSWKLHLDHSLTADSWIPLWIIITLYSISWNDSFLVNISWYVTWIQCHVLLRETAFILMIRNMQFIDQFELTQWGQVTLYGIRELGQYRMRQRLACSVPMNYLN